MAVITIRASDLGPELISGFPRAVALTTNVPATIFYTLDGTLPTIYSPVYLLPIEMPTSGYTTRLRALAISGSDIGYLDVTYQTDVTDLITTRRLDEYGWGIVVDGYDIENVLVDGYSPDEDGNVVVPSRASDYELQDLDILYSSTGVNGIGAGTLIRLGPMPEEVREQSSEVSWEASSPNDQNVYFNPRSLYIVIDGRDGYEDQSIYPILRPLSGTRNSLKYLQGKELYEPQPYISGGHVRTLYNPQKGTAVAYYFDHNETRWIKSIQHYNTEEVPSGLGNRNQTGNPLVFKWIYNKRSAI